MATNWSTDLKFTKSGYFSYIRRRCSRPTNSRCTYEDHFQLRKKRMSYAYEFKVYHKIKEAFLNMSSSFTSV